MVVTESVTESVFSEASGLSYKHESFTINGNDGVCDGVVFGISLGLYMSDNGRVHGGFCSEVLPGLRL